MQFTESAPPQYPPPPPLHDPNNLGFDHDHDHDLFFPGSASRAWPGLSSPSSKSFRCFDSASCMEQLLVHCAHAIDRSDATLAHQILWVLNTLAPPDGDSTQRLTSAFLRSLIARASRTGSCHLSPLYPTADLTLHRFSPVELAAFVDLTPHHRFGYSAANAAIAEAVDGFPVVHIVDLSTTHCMQLPTLIDSLARRPEGPPFIRLTVPISPNPSLSPPPMLDISYDELGARLVNFARSRNVGMEFRVIHSDPSDGFETLIEQLQVQRIVSEGEALVINCQMLLHYIPDETVGSDASTSLSLSLRSMFLKNLRSLEPTVVTLVDEDTDFTANNVVGRLRAAFNYLWIPYDAVDTFLPKGCERRQWYEAGICWKIENVIANEGLGRVERSETRGRWGQRMRSAGFRGVGFGEEAVGEVKGMLDEHAAGWGLKKEEEDLVLTWKGHNVVFATTWVPS